jgi:hypothetical protein
MSHSESSLARVLAGSARGPSGDSPLKEVLGSPDLRRVLPGLTLGALLYNILGLALPMALLQIMDRIVANQSLGTACSRPWCWRNCCGRSTAW